MSTPKCSVESVTTTASIPASAKMVNFWTFESSVSNKISGVGCDTASGPKNPHNQGLGRDTLKFYIKLGQR